MSVITGYIIIQENARLQVVMHLDRAYAWQMSSYGLLDTNKIASMTNGIRPVITVLKVNLYE